MSGLGREAEITTYQEGGLNDRVHVLLGRENNPGALRLERGAYAGEGLPFYLAGERLSEPMRIEVGPPGLLLRRGKAYVLTGLMVKKWEAGELDAQQNTLLIDRFDLSYEYLSVSTR